MDIRRLPADEAVVRRFLTELWIPFNRELEAIVDGFALAEDVDVVAEELDFRLDRLETNGTRTWVAVDGPRDGANLAECSSAFVGYVAVERDEAPSTFERPDRLRLCDIYVRDPYRGTAVARELVGRATSWGRENGCAELTLDVDVGNDRATAFYEKLGFEPSSRTLVADVESLPVESSD